MRGGKVVRTVEDFKRPLQFGEPMVWRSVWRSKIINETAGEIVGGERDRRPPVGFHKFCGRGIQANGDGSSLIEDTKEWNWMKRNFGDNTVDTSIHVLYADLLGLKFLNKI